MSYFRLRRFLRRRCFDITALGEHGLVASYVAPTGLICFGILLCGVAALVSGALMVWVLDHAIRVERFAVSMSVAVAMIGTLATFIGSLAAVIGFAQELTVRATFTTDDDQASLSLRSFGRVRCCQWGKNSLDGVVASAERYGDQLLWIVRVSIKTSDGPLAITVLRTSSEEEWKALVERLERIFVVTLAPAP